MDWLTNVLFPKRAEEYLKRGLLAAEANDYKKAKEEFGRAIERKPSYAEAYFQRALLHMADLDYKDAGADLEKVVSIARRYGKAYEKLAAVCLWMDKPDKALEHVDKAISIEPDNSNYLTSRAEIFLSLQMPDEALASYDSAIAKDTKNMEAYLGRGSLYVDCERYKEAISDLTEVIEADTENDEARFKRGYAFFKTGDLKKALDDLSGAIKILSCEEDDDDDQGEEPDLDVVCWEGDYYYFRGEVYDKMGEKQLAFKDFTLASRLYSEDIEDIPEINPADSQAAQFLEAHFMRARAYKKIGADEQAQNDIEIVSRALEAETKHHGLAYYRLSLISRLNGEESLAEEQLKQARLLGYYLSPFF